MRLRVGDVIEVINEAGIDAGVFELADYDWQTCSESFVHKNWAAWVASLPDELKFELDGIYFPKWIEEVFDCDNHSGLTVSHAQIGNALKYIETNIKRGGLLYGKVFYKAESRPANRMRKGGHAINWFINHNLEMKFFEPADNLIVDLTEPERKSIWFGYAA